MRKFLATMSLVIASGLCAVAAGAELRASSLESLVNAPSSSIIRSESIGDLESAASQLSLTIIVVENQKNRSYGAEVRLKDKALSDVVYLTVAEMENINVELGNLKLLFDYDSGASSNRTQGTKRCWMPAQSLHTLCPQYYEKQGERGLSLHAQKGEIFTFPKIDPTQLVTLFKQGVDRLQALEGEDIKSAGLEPRVSN